MELTSYAHGYGQSAYHFVFVPKYRYKVLQYPFVKQKCEQFFRQVAEKYNFKVHKLKILDDHVHLFVELHPSISVSKAIMLFKGITGYYMLKQFPYLRRYYRTHHFWTAGKFFRSVGNVTADVIENYIVQSQGPEKPNVAAIKRHLIAKQKRMKAQKSLQGFCA